MTQYLVAIHRPDDYDPAVSEDAAMARDIDALNEEMIAAGVRLFVGGLQPVSFARSLQQLPNGQTVASTGKYLSGVEHVGGLWVLEVASLEDALEWGRKAVAACRAAVEVRPFH